MIVEIILIVSLIVNALVIFYASRLARKLFVVGTNLEVLYDTMDVFRTHVEVIHEAEMFYGDQALQSLIQHSKDVLDIIETHDDLMGMVMEEEVEGAQEEEE